MTHKIIRQWFPDEEIKLFTSFNASYFQDEYTITTSLEDAMINTPRNLSSNIWLFVSEDTRLDVGVFSLKCKGIADSLKEANCHTTLKVFAVQGEKLGNINADNYTNFFLRNEKSQESGYIYDFSEGIFVG
jgi:hypothetical protein